MLLTKCAKYDSILKRLSDSSSRRVKYARVVELVDSLDSGSSAHSGHAGSSPASRTTKRPKLWLWSFLFESFYYPVRQPAILTTGLKNDIVCWSGELSERFKEPVLKTGDSERNLGFESLTLRQKKTYALIQSIGLFQRNKSHAGFVKYASRVKYCFAM